MANPVQRLDLGRASFILLTSSQPVRNGQKRLMLQLGPDRLLNFRIGLEIDGSLRKHEVDQL